MPQQRRLWITVSDELHAQLDALHQSTGVSRSVIVERVLLSYPELLAWAAARLASDGVKNAFKKVAAK